MLTMNLGSFVMIFLILTGIIGLLLVLITNLSLGFKTVSLPMTKPVLKILSAILLGLMAWVVPYLPIKLLLVLLAILLIGLGLPKSRVSFIILSSIIVILSFFTNPNFIGQAANWPAWLSDFGSWKSYTNSFDSAQMQNFDIEKYFSKVRVNPDKRVRLTTTTLEIDTDCGVEISLVEGEDIEYPAELRLSQKGDKTVIAGGQRGDVTYVIRLGKDNLKNLKISAIGVKLKGKGNFEEVFIDCAGAYLSSDLNVKNLNINAAGLMLNGNFAGDNLEVDGMGMELRGTYRFNNMKIDGMGAEVNMKVALKELTVDSLAINGRIEITAKPNDEAKIKLNSLAGNITLKNLDGVVLEHSGFTKINRE
ncbi:hypothetical protein ciss_14320 [Carboxydothermus islandicus]|uniref:Adhesin domain-containing protein n=1 Tax=Carboxydothermus islandicus TaxID=661089 RepID=A0A1L8D2V7_9THEO|nr:hypothetical protein [Carboxydothermus islandicus]GAV25499.1 hypothetical protein ciss_14320 [Carboxydothermus islandicus]